MYAEPGMRCPDVLKDFAAGFISDKRIKYALDCVEKEKYSLDVLRNALVYGLNYQNNKYQSWVDNGIAVNHWQGKIDEYNQWIEDIEAGEEVTIENVTIPAPK